MKSENFLHVMCIFLGQFFIRPFKIFSLSIVIFIQFGQYKIKMIFIPLLIDMNLEIVNIHCKSHYS